MTLGRVMFTAVGGVMVLLGSLAIAYGAWFPRMFALFDPAGSLILGIGVTAAGFGVLIWARRRLTDRPAS
jgi:hypothetical protein